MISRRTVAVDASSLIEVVGCHLGAPGAPAPGSLREVLAARLTDPLRRRGDPALAGLAGVGTGRGGGVRVLQPAGDRRGGGGLGSGGTGRAGLPVRERRPTSHGRASARNRQDEHHAGVSRVYLLWTSHTWPTIQA